MIMFDKISKIIVLVILASVIILPIALFNHDPEKKMPYENRYVAKMPAILMDENNINMSFPDEFEDFYSDNIGFRDEVIRINAEAIYNIFNVAIINSYIMGEDGHLFYTDSMRGIESFQGINSISEEELQSVLYCANIINDYYLRRNIPLIIANAPAKQRIYPEYYPKSVLQHDSVSYCEEVVSYIQNNSDIHIVDLMHRLLEEKKGSNLLYCKKADPTHWNMIGAFAGYQQIMEELKIHLPDITILNESDFQISQKDVDVSTIWSMPIGFIDTIYTYDRKNGYSAVEMDELDFGNDEFQELFAGIPENLRFYYKNENVEQKKLLIVGDSFVYSFMLPMFAESFSEVLFIQHPSADMLSAATENFSPDIVLFEYADRVYSEALFSQYYQLEGK